MLRLFPTLAICLLLAARPALAEPVACADPRFAVDAGEPALRARLCDAAAEMADQLTGCGLSQDRPLDITVVPTIHHPFAQCLAAFDCAFDRIRLTEPARYPDLLEPDDPYATFPPEDLMLSLLRHEMAHALVEQTAGDAEIDLLDHEFIAAAMELDFMAPAQRAELLDHAMLEAPRNGLLDIWIYRLEPRRFAVNAWLHFRRPGNGCDLIGRLARGETSLADHKD